MPKRESKEKPTGQKLDPAIVVALIGLLGTLITVLISNADKISTWLSPSAVPTVGGAIQSATAAQPGEKRIGLNQVVTGTLYYNEGDTWIFSEGPATVTITLDVSTYGSALIILFDPSGVQREYVDGQEPGIARLVNYTIPSAGDYSIFVRNTNNSQVNYTLTVQDARTSVP
jgi:hypothetical protein